MSKQKRCPNGSRRDKKTGECVPYKKVKVKAVKTKNISVKEYSGKSSISDTISKLKEFNLAAVAVGALAIITSINFFIAGFWVFIDWALPGTLVVLGLMVSGGLAYYGKAYYDHRQQTREDIVQWQLYAVRINECIDSKTAKNDLKELKTEIEEYCGSSDECTGELVGKIDAILECQNVKDCKKTLNATLKYLTGKIKTNLNKKNRFRFQRGNRDPTCKIPDYKFDISKDAIKVYQPSYHIGNGKERMNYSIPLVKPPIRKDTERKNNILRAVAMEVQNCVVNEISAIHAVQFSFLENAMLEEKSYFGFFSSVPKEFEQINAKIVEIRGRDMESFSKFFCQFQSHYNIIQGVYNDKSKSERLEKAKEALDEHIEQIKTIRKIQIATIEKLYTAYMNDVSELVDPEYLSMAMSLFGDTGEEFKGLFLKAMSWTKPIEDIDEDNSYLDLFVALGEATRDDKLKAYSDEFAPMKQFKQLKF
tara:strand:- start:596 stop:2029 length:1434 start_codon:yes stop_codon:yes gene_type:complete